MSTDIKTFAEVHWADFLGSKTVKAIIAAEVLAVPGFIESVLSGSIPFNRTTVAAFLASQVAAVVALTLRHALSELKAHAAGLIPAEVIDDITKTGQDKAIAILKSEGHNTAAEALATAFKKPVTI